MRTRARALSRTVHTRTRVRAGFRAGRRPCAMGRVRRPGAPAARRRRPALAGYRAEGHRAVVRDGRGPRDRAAEEERATGVRLVALGRLDRGRAGLTGRPGRALRGHPRVSGGTAGTTGTGLPRTLAATAPLPVRAPGPGLRLTARTGAPRAVAGRARTRLPRRARCAVPGVARAAGSVGRPRTGPVLPGGRRPGVLVEEVRARFLHGRGRGADAGRRDERFAVLRRRPAGAGHPGGAVPVPDVSGDGRVRVVALAGPVVTWGRGWGAHVRRPVSARGWDGGLHIYQTGAALSASPAGPTPFRASPCWALTDPRKKFPRTRVMARPPPALPRCGPVPSGSGQRRRGKERRSWSSSWWSASWN